VSAVKPSLTRREFLRLGVGAGLAGLALPLSLRTAIAEEAAVAPSGSTSARILSHGDRSKRVLALTIDDGWSPERVRQLFDILQRANVAATFMPYARAMTADRPLWRRIAAAGYPVGNHTTTHPHLSQLSPAQQLSEIATARAMAEDITGRPMIRAFRPPYGDYDRSVTDAAVRAGFPTVILWDTSDRDTSPQGTAQEMIAAAQQGQNGSLLLTHGGPPLTPVILPAIIAFYKARGFRFVTVSDLFGLAGPHPVKVAATPRPGSSGAPAASRASARPRSQPPEAAGSPAASGAASGGAGAPGDPAPDNGGVTSAADIVPELAVLTVASVVAVGVGATRRLRANRD
jgi:peptidoglycan/xylan/chitin deacetylase (PgdA/CDA1 family)